MSAEHEAPAVDPSKVISPKVLAALAVGLVMTIGATALSALTPDALAWAGPYAVPLCMGLVAAGQALAGYLRADPARSGLPAPDAS